MFADSHSHLLYSVDDGPKALDETLEMLDAAYKDGVRSICVTPHFNFSFFGDNTEKAKSAYGELCLITKDKYPDMKLYFGCEIFYHNECVELLNSGVCPTIAGTKHVLVDFSSDVDLFTVEGAVKKIISYGYIPIIAHAERYRIFQSDTLKLKRIKESGAIVSVNAASVVGLNSRKEMSCAKKIINKGLCDTVASDAHDTKKRPFCFGACYEYLKKHYSKETAELLTYIRSQKILDGLRM